MSTATTVIDTTRPGVPFGRLVRVETRKMFDTRAGLWLMIVTGGLMLLTMVITLLVVGFNDNASITASGFSQIMTIPLSILLPVFAIVTVTSEWGQRSNLVTFTLEPRRSRVFAAKLVSVLILALGTIVVAIIFGVLGNLLAGAVTGDDVVWNVDVKDLSWAVGLQLAYFLMAFAFAMLLLNSPATIAIFYVIALILPFMVYPALIFFVGPAEDIIPWFDFNYAAAPLIGVDFEGNPITDAGVFEVVRFIGSLLIMVGLPGGIGLRRVLTSEVK